MTDVPTAPSTNGAAHAMSGREQLVAQTRALASGLEARRDELRGDLAAIESELRAYEKALAALDPESVPEPRQKRPYRKRGTTTHQGVGAEKIADFERAARALGAGGREFRTIDLIRHLGGHANSGVASMAVAALRDTNVIRLTRNAPGPGGGKFYRLTRPALRETHQPDESSPPAPPLPIRPAKDATRERVLDAIRSFGRPATLTAIIETSGVSDVAVRNAVRTLQAEGAVLDVGAAEVRADGAASGKMPRTYVVAEGAEA